MEYRRRRILFAEIGRQCRFAMIAYSDASVALEKRDPERCWYSLQSLLAAALQLQHLLWPHEGSAVWGSELRSALEVADDSPLNQSGLPELDISSMVESWSVPRSGHPPALPNLSSGGLADAAHTEWVRCFDPETGAFTFFGRSIQLPPLLTAIADLARTAEAQQQHLRELV